MTTATLPEYVTPEYLNALNLRSGCGTGEPGDRCAWQEYRTWVGLDASSWSCPDTASPVLHQFTVGIQDASGVWRKKLSPEFGPALLFSRQSDEIELQRAIRLADWALREILPDAIDATVALCDGDSEPVKELIRLAAELRAHAPVADLADLADLADRAARAALAALAALAARAARAALAALAARAARAARADLAGSGGKYWPKIAEILTELLEMKA